MLRSRPEIGHFLQFSAACIAQHYDRARVLAAANPGLEVSDELRVLAVDARGEPLLERPLGVSWSSPDCPKCAALGVPHEARGSMYVCPRCGTAIKGLTPAGALMSAVVAAVGSGLLASLSPRWAIALMCGAIVALLWGGRHQTKATAITVGVAAIWCLGVIAFVLR